MILTSSPPSSSLSLAVYLESPLLLRYKGFLSLRDLTTSLTRADDNTCTTCLCVTTRSGHKHNLCQYSSQYQLVSSSCCFKSAIAHTYILGHTSVPLWFQPCGCAPRQVLNALAAALISCGASTWHSSFTARGSGVSNPVCSPTLSRLSVGYRPKSRLRHLVFSLEKRRQKKSVTIISSVNQPPARLRPIILDNSTPHVFYILRHVVNVTFLSWYTKSHPV